MGLDGIVVMKEVVDCADLVFVGCEVFMYIG